MMNRGIERTSRVLDKDEVNIGNQELKHWSQDVSRKGRLRSVAIISLMALICFCLWSQAALSNVTKDFSSQQEVIPMIVKPFKELKGPKYHIFCPACWDNAEETAVDEQLLAMPETWVRQLVKKYQWLEEFSHDAGENRTIEERARSAYIQMLQKYVMAEIWGSDERSVPPALYNGHKGKHPVNPYDSTLREKGNDWTYLGVTMVGTARLNNLHAIMEDVFRGNISGDFIETGVWRGGSSIFARGLLRAYAQGDRVSYVCDSFAGLPPGEKKLHRKDAHWDNTPYLSVSSEQVATHFRQAGLLDQNTIFAKGFFNETMVPLKNHIKTLAVMRLDGDIYESTVDVLYNLYDKLSIGGYLIMDDWYGFPSRNAVEDFFKVHGKPLPSIVKIDDLSAYWKKMEQVDIQYWRYERYDRMAFKNPNASQNSTGSP